MELGSRGFPISRRSIGTIDISISIEPVNRSETFFLRTATEAKELCKLVASSRFGVTIDTFHANIEEKSIPAAIQSLGPLLRHIHMSENHRGVLGTGHVHLRGCIEALKQIDYTGYVVIEGFGYSPGVTTSPGFLWADLDVAPEDIALRGLAYLKSNFR
jgi:D-psicose/D-tagatose/L-ribulose 3-epimerase